MNSYNKVILLGNLTRDPEVRHLPRGTACATFGLALNKKYKGENGEMVETVSYIDIVAYGRPAENCGKYLHKGDAVLVEGELRQRRWDDKDTGAKRSKVEVVAAPMGITFLPRSGSSNTSDKSEPSDVPPGIKEQFPGAQSVPDPVDEDKIPF